MEARISDELSAVFHRYGIQSVAACLVLGYDATIEFFCFFGRQAFGHILHDAFVAVHFGERRYIVVAPRSYYKSVGLNHDAAKIRISRAKTKFI